ncbi:MAG TPA: hypothetical protein VHD56_14695 [Tepidisphaeraceae bacterium]|nr:hypothetical protein [Tepidisphaeraceae bacterium]
MIQSALTRAIKQAMAMDFAKTATLFATFWRKCWKILQWETLI